MKIFFSGIGGSGVSAIAGFMKENGHTVGGSDRLFDKDPAHPICRMFQAQGMQIAPHNGSGITNSFDLSVFSTAVEKSSREFQKALELGIPVKTRPEYLAEIVANYRTIAVAGTSGKSTIAGMLAFLMQQLGMAPNFIGGGRVKQFRTETNPGNYATGTSDLLVLEACESDGSIINYSPAHAIISNLDLDHHAIPETGRMFERLSEKTSGIIIIGLDDTHLSSCNISNAVGFSIEKKSGYQADNIEYHPFRTLFTLHDQKFRLSMPGKYNLYNALACIAFLMEFGISRTEISSILSEFSGIERRFDIHLNDDRYLVIDDYAHNPHKISCLMQTMQKISKSVCYIFQPHGYGPVRLMKDGYISVFSSGLRDSDHLVLLPIFYAGGTVAKDISSEDIADGVFNSGRSVETVEDRDEVFDMLGKWESMVVLGARDDTLSVFAGSLADRLR